MKPESFAETRTGELVRTHEGAWAFVPAPIPRELALDPESVRLLARAENALGHLNGATGRLVNPFLVGSPLLHREAILSSRIEGTVTTPEELVLFDMGATGRRASSTSEDTREVRNYIDAMRHGLDLLKSLPMCLRLIREIHGVLLRGVRGERERPGEFRQVQNFIGARETDTIHTARYVPPPVRAMNVLLDDLERHLKPPRSASEPDADPLPLLIRLAVIHYQFEAIHPFRDGNGRVGRLLIPLTLCAQEQLAEPLLYLSGYFERFREQYYDQMLRVSQEGDWLGWIKFFLRGVADSAKDATERTCALLDLRQAYHDKFHSARSSALLLKLIDELFRRPSMTIGEAATLLDITHASASANIKKLCGAGILTEWTGRKRDQMFLATGIVAFLRDSKDGSESIEGQGAKAAPNGD